MYYNLYIQYSRKRFNVVKMQTAFYRLRVICDKLNFLIAH